MKCNKSGCQNQATCKPKICVPRKGRPLGSNEHLPMMLSLSLCDTHFNELRPRHFLTPEAEEAITRSIEGDKVPDFDNAYIERVPLGRPNGAKVNPEHF